MLQKTLRTKLLKCSEFSLHFVLFFHLEFRGVLLLRISKMDEFPEKVLRGGGSFLI